MDDQLIIRSRDLRPAEDVTRIAPNVLTFTRDNEVGEVLTYAASRDADGRLTFAILKEGEAQPVPYKEEDNGFALPGLGFAGGSRGSKRG